MTETQIKDAARGYLFLRMPEEALVEINERFGSIVKSGTIVQRDALPAEKNEPDLKDLPRLVFRHRRKDYGMLRCLINAVNDLVV